MKVEFLKQFNRDAKKMSVQKVRDEVIQAIENIENAANKKNIEELSGFKNAFRIKIGDYRIGIFIMNYCSICPCCSSKRYL
jgi:mRNA interferase RelE/StbE